jgi:aspartate aminotransferase-like enzyme
MLNDLDMLKALAHRHGARLCLDCVSAVGAVPLDLTGVHLASGASGKALAALPGLSLVFHTNSGRPEPERLPRYLDLGYYAGNGGIPFTHSSNLLAALGTALDRFDSPEPFEQILALSQWIRPRLRELGLSILVPDEHATPAVITLEMPAAPSSQVVGDCLQRQGLLVAYQSEYLVRRNWLQIGLMGHCTQADLERLLGALKVTTGLTTGCRGRRRKEPLQISQRP